MRILYITDYIPYPPIAGDLIRNYHLIRGISREHKVSLVGFVSSLSEQSGVSHMSEFCHRVEAVILPRRRKLARIPRLIRYVLAGIPFDFEFLFSEELVQKIRSLAETEDFDIVQIAHSRMAPYREALPPGGHAKTVLSFHNVASTQYDSISHIASTRAKRIRAWLHGRMLRRWEPYYAEHFDRCITVSEDDRQSLLASNPRLSVDVITNGVDTKKYQVLPLEETQPVILFTGNMSYAPNIDGAIWFCREILPHIRRVLPDIQVWIVGISPTSEVLALEGDGVRVTGRVEDITPYFRRSTVSVVPLRAGGGTRHKILEAMAFGRPVISTTLGCEGLDVKDSQHLLIADDPIQFAEKTVRLLVDKELHHSIAYHARQLIEERYDWDAITKQLITVYTDML